MGEGQLKGGHTAAEALAAEWPPKGVTIVTHTHTHTLNTQIRPGA